MMTDKLMHWIVATAMEHTSWCMTRPGKACQNVDTGHLYSGDFCTLCPNTSA